MKPDKIEYKIGDTIHAQPIKLVFERDYLGREYWTIIQEPANQRDDRNSVSGLTKELIIKMAEAVKST